MKKNTVFVIQPHSDASQAVFTMIAAAASRAGATAYTADGMENVNNSFLESLHSAIRKADLIVAEVTNATVNVMYEVGFAQAEKKPIIYMATSSRSIPIDFSGIPAFIYDIKSPDETVSIMTDAIRLALKEPDTFAFATTNAERQKRHSVFISYNHRDKDFLDRLLVHLKPLEKDGLIDLWADTKLRPGDRWKTEIERALNKATVAVLLISADFLASDFITENELPPLLKGAEQKGTRIVPLIVKPCRFTRDPNLRHFQAVNDPKDALILLDIGAQEIVYDQVAAEIEKSLQRG